MKRRLAIAAILLVIVGIPVYVFVSRHVEQWRIEHYEVTGTVYDAATKKPMAGAYVVAMYTFVRAFHGSSTYCWKSRSQVTGPDGRFRFPLEKLGPGNPEVHAVVEGYYVKEEETPTSPDWHPESAEFYLDRDIYLARQDPENPNPYFLLGEGCTPEFKNPDDSIALNEFARRVNAESMRYFNKKAMYWG